MNISNSNTILRLGVKQLNDLANLQLQTIGEVVVEGEVTEFSISKRKGVNLVLKDKQENAIVSISGYAPEIEGLNMIEQGIEVAIWGRPQIYSPYGKFSISIYKILPLGDGALSRALEILKNKLEKEGLFDIGRKRHLPQLVTKIALITAKGSAASTDFLKILQENSNCLDIDLYPVAVQGKHAVEEVVFALKTAQMIDYDCIVLTRGGGSLEDLSAFNDEKVARAIFASKPTTMVAIGHEKDITIAELSADIRASTPSQAAYYFISNTTSVITAITTQTDQIYNLIRQQITLTTKEVSIDNLYNKIISILNQQNIIFHNYGSSFKTEIINYLNNYKHTIATTSSILDRFDQYIKNSLKEISYYEHLFNSLNPKNVIQRGYAIIKNDNGDIISSISKISLGDKINLVVKDGEVTSVVKEIK